jgi:glycosyltransferase involved in cell wall biosynthesis
MRNDLTVVILTFNEELHIERCLRSVEGVAQKIFIVDSYSTDRTVEIAESMGAVVVQRKWKNYADQFQWGIDHYPEHCGGESAWVMRLDADEYLTPELREEICQRLPSESQDVTGLIVERHVFFMGRVIRHGGHQHFLLRIWRHGKAHIEATWMDEHIVLSGGRTSKLGSRIYDHNLNNITWWTNKHNGYASREAVDLLNKRYHFLANTPGDRHRGQAATRRWLKDKLYVYMPLGWRAFFFFIYRVVFRLGFLDGREGMFFHFLQGYWYRVLVDAKVLEVEQVMRKERISCVEAIRRELGINLEEKL